MEEVNASFIFMNDVGWQFIDLLITVNHKNVVEIHVFYMILY